MHNILINPRIEYEVSTQDDVTFNVVKWVENDPTHYIVKVVRGGYTCNCPARVPVCKHIKMVKAFRQRRYAAAGYGKKLDYVVVRQDDREHRK